MISGVNENACLQSVSMKQIHLLMRRVSMMSTLTLRTSQVRLAIQAAFCYLLPSSVIISSCRDLISMSGAPLWTIQQQARVLVWLQASTWNMHACVHLSLLIFHDLGVSYHGVFSLTSAKVLRHLPLGPHDCVYLLALRLLVEAGKKFFKSSVVRM